MALFLASKWNIHINDAYVLYMCHYVRGPYYISGSLPAWLGSPNWMYLILSTVRMYGIVYLYIASHQCYVHTYPSWIPSISMFTIQTWKHHGHDTQNTIYKIMGFYRSGHKCMHIYTHLQSIRTIYHIAWGVCVELKLTVDFNITTVKCI